MTLMLFTLYTSLLDIDSLTKQVLLTILVASCTIRRLFLLHTKLYCHDHVGNMTRLDAPLASRVCRHPVLCTLLVSVPPSSSNCHPSWSLAMDNLRCNRLTCRRPLADKAVVTTCSHIFCVDCANELFNASRLCPGVVRDVPDRTG
ncbi:hypothetical protein BC628DRAFT_1131130 [Trametes gibbosa]|nr:hypothetical protein BC628DRAFT_1131130 [Trametes gibbosa]